MTLPRGYDAWRLASPDDDRHEVGTEDGQPCLRYPEDDEDMGRARKRPCTGTMVRWIDPDGIDEIECDTCGEAA